MTRNQIACMTNTTTRTKNLPLSRVTQMVIDTLFMCFCEDVSTNDGSPGKEPYAPESLMAFFNEQAEQDGVAGYGGGGDSVPMQPYHQQSPGHRPAKEEAV